MYSIKPYGLSEWGRSLSQVLEGGRVAILAKMAMRCIPILAASCPNHRNDLDSWNLIDMYCYASVYVLSVYVYYLKIYYILIFYLTYHVWIFVPFFCVVYLTAVWIHRDAPRIVQLFMIWTGAEARIYITLWFSTHGRYNNFQQGHSKDNQAYMLNTYTSVNKIWSMAGENIR